jgi:hypothetical protein
MSLTRREYDDVMMRAESKFAAARQRVDTRYYLPDIEAQAAAWYHTTPEPVKAMLRLQQPEQMRVLDQKFGGK